ncbi:Trp biosynthesis-associated membrane protein [Leifsonia sp. NPDC058248]|uniref:Trp biosynthesis-associated membrane protein n=1 Tax=Leifsonia sp. NPDC058248 TaxID=3346402 RepID=UPI0036DF81A0
MSDATEPVEPAGEVEEAAEARTPRRVSRGAKYLTLLLLVIGSGLTLLASTQTWFSVTLTAAANHAGAIIVQGSAAAPALTALSLAGLALTAALAIAGPVFRIVLALLGILLGVSVLISAGSALGDALGSASAAITSATGVAGDASLSRLVARIDTAIWPAIAIAGGVVLVLASAAVIVTTRLWPGPSRRYETRFEDPDGAHASDPRTRDAQDADTPTPDAPTPDARTPDARTPDARAQVSDDDEARAAAEAGEQSGGTGTTRPLERDRAIDSWDELSRGEDPTR